MIGDVSVREGDSCILYMYKNYFMDMKALIICRGFRVREVLRIETIGLRGRKGVS